MSRNTTQVGQADGHLKLDGALASGSLVLNEPANETPTAEADSVKAGMFQAVRIRGKGCRQQVKRM